MQMVSTKAKTRDEQVDVALKIGVVVLTLTTSVIHLSLGGLLFLANAAAFGTLAAAMIVPGAFADRFRWLVKLALLGTSVGTIGGWFLFGARYFTGYLATTIEIAIAALLIVDLYRAYGGPLTVARRIRSEAARLRAQGAARA